MPRRSFRIHRSDDDLELVITGIKVNPIAQRDDLDWLGLKTLYRERYNVPDLLHFHAVMITASDELRSLIAPEGFAPSIFRFKGGCVTAAPRGKVPRPKLTNRITCVP